MRIFTVVAILALAGAALPASAASVLYSPTSNPPELLDASPWNWNFTAVNGGTHSAGSFGTILDTSADSNSHAGFNITNGGAYNNALMPILSASAGYDVRFQVAVTAETHTSDDRAGFSIIAISSDNTKAIELGFHTDQIFSQSSDFNSHAEDVAFNTTGLTTYDLTVLGSSYTLTSGATTLLSGSLHTYNGNANPINNAIYLQTNWIFLGDDTTSAAGTAEIAHVEVIALPEPGSLVLLGVGAAALLRRRK